MFWTDSGSHFKIFSFAAIGKVFLYSKLTTKASHTQGEVNGAGLSGKEYDLHCKTISRGAKLQKVRYQGRHLERQGFKLGP